ncbi:MAG: MarR family transcriptional regulator [Coriobacteriaceae bacterium]|nr:MarR family transcriptional regulator [Coriobacteriaceae bacterium]
MSTVCGVPDLSAAEDTPAEARARAILSNLGFCGHFMHFHAGGRSGQAPIICLIAKHGGTISQQKLGSYFDLKPGSLSEVLTKLETAGIIERTRNPHDRRQLTIRLTEAGVEQAEIEQQHRVKFRQTAFACLTDEEQEELLYMLDKIHVHWEEIYG